MSGPNPSGLCMCGCGQATPVALRNRHSEGRVKGHPIRFISGHNMRSSATTMAERLHAELQTRFDGCVEFVGYRMPNGYGRTSWNGRKKLAHRLAWELANGRIPDGMQVLHRCDNPPCCNVEHLFLGTVADNMRDMAAKGRSPWQQKTHCPQGHPYDETNTVVRHGHRYCRTCSNRKSERKVRVNGEST